MTSSQFRPIRSALYLPASNQRAIEKSRALHSDVVIFDLEDAVAPAQKAAARANLVLAFGIRPTYQRSSTHLIRLWFALRGGHENARVPPRVAGLEAASG